VRELLAHEGHRWSRGYGGSTRRWSMGRGGGSTRDAAKRGFRYLTRLSLAPSAANRAE
jgi:hypothetical protein